MILSTVSWPLWGIGGCPVDGGQMDMERGKTGEEMVRLVINRSSSITTSAQSDGGRMMEFNKDESHY